MPTAIQAPKHTGPTVKAGPRVFRKQVLKYGTINYPDPVSGKTFRLTFDKAYADKVMTAFNAKAYDQVPFILANEKNQHHMNPEAFRGQVVGLEQTGDGLDILMRATEEGAKLLDENPELGVSARFVQEMARADGTTFPVAMQHVLGTFDPRLTGLRPWEQLTDLSSDPSNVVDLTAATYEGEPMTKEEMAELADLVAAKLKPADETSTSTTATATVPPPAGDLTPEEEAELQAILDADETPDPAAAPTTAPASAETVREPVGASLANPAVDLAVAEQMPARIQALEEVLAEERFDAWAKDLVRQGVRPALINLARPALSKPGSLTIDLSTADPADERAIIRRMLEEDKGSVDLSRSVGTTEDAGDVPASERAEHVKAWREKYQAS